MYIYIDFYYYSPFFCDSRLQKELSVKELDYQESLKTLEKKNSTEIQTLNTKITELERSNGETQEEVSNRQLLENIVQSKSLLAAVLLLSTYSLL